MVIRNLEVEQGPPSMRRRGKSVSGAMVGVRAISPARGGRSMTRQSRNEPCRTILLADEQRKLRNRGGTRLRTERLLRKGPPRSEGAPHSLRAGRCEARLPLRYA